MTLLIALRERQFPSRMPMNEFCEALEVDTDRAKEKSHAKKSRATFPPMETLTEYLKKQFNDVFITDSNGKSNWIKVGYILEHLYYDYDVQTNEKNLVEEGANEEEVADGNNFFALPFYSYKNQQ